MIFLGKYCMQTGVTKFVLIVQVATLAVIAGLGLGGPFYNPLCLVDSINTQTEYIAGDGHLSTSVGSFDSLRQVFKTGAKDGALIFGPYLSIQSGRYSVTWFGTVSEDSEPQFEVFSATTGVLYSGKPMIKPTMNNVALHIIPFEIPIQTDGVEFRVLVSNRDKMDIHSVSLTTLSCNNQ
jgi:hypothetical protein